MQTRGFCPQLHVDVDYLIDSVPKAFARTSDGNTGEIGHISLSTRVERTTIERHHGSLRCTSVVGEGSTFTIRLPISGSQTASEGGSRDS